jgi:hypothetical protein
VLRRLNEVSATDTVVTRVEAHVIDNSVFAQGEFSAEFAATALAIINFVFAKFAKFFV